MHLDSDQRTRHVLLKVELWRVCCCHSAQEVGCGCPYSTWNFGCPSSCEQDRFPNPHTGEPNTPGATMREVVVWVLLATTRQCEAYFPGATPSNFVVGDRVEVKVNSLTTNEGSVPFSFYHLPYCQPVNGVMSSTESLGEILLGESVQNSNFDVHALQDVNCSSLCNRVPVAISNEQRNLFETLIENGYYVRLMVDNLPVLEKHIGADDGNEFYTLGFPVGHVVVGEQGEKQYFVNNHVALTIYHTKLENQKSSGWFGVGSGDIVPKTKIVGFEALPSSVAGGTCSVIQTTDGMALQNLKEFDQTYSVQWKQADIPWVSRWDAFASVQTVGYYSPGGISWETAKTLKRNNQSRWFSIINSSLLVLLLTASMSAILIRALRRDIDTYNEDDTADTFGWKLVHGDVFRKPSHSTILTALVGSGVQVWFMTVGTLVMMIVGVLSPFSRGSLIQCGIILWAMMGSVCGFTAARFYKMFQSDHWRLTTVRTALMYPGVVFCVFFCVNLSLWGQGSSAAVPFSTLLTLLLIWFGMSIPLVLLGAFLGFKQAPFQFPVRVNKIPRPIPEQKWLATSNVLAAVGGLICFSTAYHETISLLVAITSHRVYTLFGFALVTFFILSAACAVVSILCIYVTLAEENYHWWWRSFFCTGSSGVVSFLYWTVCCYRKHGLSFGTLPIFLGFGVVFSFTMAVVTGTIGFLASFFFVRTIYQYIKID